MSGNTPLPLLPSETQRGKINVVIEVPKGADSKFKYLPEAGAFILHRSLPAGMVFPYDYGLFRALSARMATRWTSWCLSIQSGFQGAGSKRGCWGSSLARRRESSGSSPTSMP